MRENKEKIRDWMGSLSPEDAERFGVLIEAIQNERDIIPFIPDAWLEYLKEKSATAKALADADFLIGLTDEILPEYSEILRGRGLWLGRQLDQLKEVIEQ